MVPQEHPDATILAVGVKVGGQDAFGIVGQPGSNQTVKG